VLLHSASGPIAEGAPYEEWPRILNEVGIATFAVDGYSGRGLFIPADSGKIGSLTLTRIVDAFRALEVVAKDPRIDPSRIAVMGFSQGGAAALYSSMARFQKMYGKADLQFVGHISAYGICATRYHDDEDVTKPRHCQRGILGILKHLPKVNHGCSVASNIAIMHVGYA